MRVKIEETYRRKRRKIVAGEVPSHSRIGHDEYLFP